MLSMSRYIINFRLSGFGAGYNGGLVSSKLDTDFSRSRYNFPSFKLDGSISGII